MSVRISWNAFRHGLLLVAILVGGCGPEEDHEDRFAQRNRMPPALSAQATLLPDFGAIRSIPERKSSFFSYLRPFVRAESRRILMQRARLENLYDRHLRGKVLVPADVLWLSELARDYGVSGFAVDREPAWKSLVSRVDILPEPLVLVQGANESAWGTSRFAREGNAIFGQWSYQLGWGMVPARRDSGETHEVARFQDVSAAVRSYLGNINRHPAYRELRAIRRAQRERRKVLDSYALAGGLLRYSERREAYVEEIRGMLRDNQIFLFPTPVGI